MNRLCRSAASHSCVINEHDQDGTGEVRSVQRLSFIELSSTRRDLSNALAEKTTRPCYQIEVDQRTGAPEIKVSAKSIYRKPVETGGSKERSSGDERSD